MKKIMIMLSAMLLMCGCSGKGESSSALPAANTAEALESSVPDDNSATDDNSSSADDESSKDETPASADKTDTPTLTGFADSSSFTLEFSGFDDADGVVIKAYYPQTAETVVYDDIPKGAESYVIKSQKSGVQGVFSAVPYTLDGDKKTEGEPAPELTLTTMRRKMMIDIKSICQYSKPALPTGCECTALATVLKYYSILIPKEYIAKLYLDKQEFTLNKKDELIGGDPEEVFVGDPFDENSYGCYSKPVANAANRIFEGAGSALEAEACDGKALSYWFDYVNNGTPVIVWATTNMDKTEKTDTWKTKDGKEITWLHNEHCLVLAGFNLDKNEVYVCDPLCRNTGLVRYDMKLFEKRYNEQGKRAVLIQQGGQNG